MKLWTIFSAEFAYIIRRTATMLCLAVLLLFTLVMNGLTTPGDGVYANNTFHITAISVIGGLIWLVMAAAIAGEAASRDVQTRMHPLTYTTPITKGSYLGGRFLAAFAVNALLVLVLPMGVLLSFHLPGLEGGALQPFRPWAYISVYLLIALPNAFVATAVQFTVAALSRQVLTSYGASLLLAIFPQLIAVSAAQLFGNWDLVKLLDPVGIAGIMGSELATWTPTQKNTRLITLEGMFLWNRILWLGVAAGALWLTYHRFRFAHAVQNTWWRRFKRRSKEGTKPGAVRSLAGATPIVVPPVHRSFGWATDMGQALTIGGASFRKIARNPIGLTLVGVIALGSAVFGSRIMTQFGIPVLPTTGGVVDYLTAPVGAVGTPWVVIPLLLMYFAGELVRSDRDARLSDIVDAAPVREWVFFTGKFLGLAGIIVVWMALLLAGGIGMQLGLGYNGIDLGLYLQALFGLQFVDYALFAVLALVVHVVVAQKFVGYIVVLLVFGFIAFPSHFGVEHPLLIFGADPGWWYSDMRGFGPTIGPWLWFKLYWMAWAVLLAVAARALWARGREQGLGYRLQMAQHRLRRYTTWVAVIAAALVVIVGSFIYYNTNVLNEYDTGSHVANRKADYERRYARYRATPQPTLSATKLHVEIYPDQQQVDIRAAYTLVNTNTVSIDSIHLGSISGIELREVAFNRRAAGVLIDKELGHYIYALAQPLQPGDSVQVAFAVRHKERGFRHNGTAALVMTNGTCFTNFDLLPGIGYQPVKELKDPVSRGRHKLPARPLLPSLYDTAARKASLVSDGNAFEATVGTAGNEVAVAPGRLHRSWSKGGRRYFHYKTDAPIANEYAFLSGRYAVQESRWNDVTIRIYYHPDHGRNIDRMLQSVKSSLAHFTEQFGPYPYGHITVVERAGAGGGASADASMILYGEQYSLMHPDDGPNNLDLPYYILAHEVAHQWWGLARLTPAHVEGAGVLIEGLAVYAGMQVLERNYGAGHLQQYVSYLHTSYEMPRSLATPSLLQANETFLYYRKGGLALYTLSKYIGKEKVNGALRSLLQKRSSGELPLPTTLDLYGELQKVTPDSLQYLLTDLFQQNTYWRLKTESIAATPTPGGNWEVILKVQAQKVIIDSTGEEKDVPMNDWLEVGLYKEGKGLHDPLYLQRHRIRSGAQTIKVTVQHQPDRGGIDPNQLMIDLRLDDNMRELGG